MRKRKFKRYDKNPSHKRTTIILCILAILLAGIAAVIFPRIRNQHNGTDTEATDTIVVKDTIYKYGLPIEEFAVKNDTIRPRQTLAEVLMGYGLSAKKVFDLTQCPDSVFDVRKVRAGQPCALLTDKDSIATPRYFVYEVSAKEYVVFNLTTDSVMRGIKPTSWQQHASCGTVESSLWNAMVDNGTSPQLAVLLP